MGRIRKVATSIVVVGALTGAAAGCAPAQSLEEQNTQIFFGLIFWSIVCSVPGANCPHFYLVPAAPSHT